MSTSVMNAAVRLANEAGLRGERVTIVWIPPQRGTDDPNGQFVVVPQQRRSASES